MTAVVPQGYIEHERAIGIALRASLRASFKPSASAASVTRGHKKSRLGCFGAMFRATIRATRPYRPPASAVSVTLGPMFGPISETTLHIISEVLGGVWNSDGTPGPHPSHPTLSVENDLLIMTFEGGVADAKEFEIDKFGKFPGAASFEVGEEGDSLLDVYRSFTVPEPLYNLFFIVRSNMLFYDADDGAMTWDCVGTKQAEEGLPSFYVKEWAKDIVRALGGVKTVTFKPHRHHSHDSARCVLCNCSKRRRRKNLLIPDFAQ